jgi:CheY-like chemotaxis protein
MKIAIVDDNLSMRKVLAALFTAKGHQVVASLGDGNGLAACLKQQAPDLLCLDYHLPGQNGLALLAAVQAASPEVDVLMITASEDPELEGRAADAGASGFLRKPFSQTQILAELQHVEEARRVVARTVAKPSAPQADEGVAARRTAVVVDDNGSMRLLLKGILEEMGIRVLQTVANGAEAVEAAKRHQPDLVCLDVDMPRMSGLEALPQVLAASPLSRAVMVTGHPDKAFVQAAAAAGAKGYILKPVRPAYVQDFVKKLFA